MRTHMILVLVLILALCAGMTAAEVKLNVPSQGSTDTGAVGNDQEAGNKTASDNTGNGLGRVEFDFGKKTDTADDDGGPDDSSNDEGKPDPPPVPTTYNGEGYVTYPPVVCGGSPIIYKTCYYNGRTVYIRVGSSTKVYSAIAGAFAKARAEWEAGDRATLKAANKHADEGDAREAKSRRTADATEAHLRSSADKVEAKTRENNDQYVALFAALLVLLVACGWAFGRR